MMTVTHPGLSLFVSQLLQDNCVFDSSNVVIIEDRALSYIASNIERSRSMRDLLLTPKSETKCRWERLTPNSDSRIMIPSREERNRRDPFLKPSSQRSSDPSLLRMPKRKESPTRSDHENTNRYKHLPMQRNETWKPLHFGDMRNSESSNARIETPTIIKELERDCTKKGLDPMLWGLKPPTVWNKKNK